MTTHIVYGAERRPFVKRVPYLSYEEELKQDVLSLESLCFSDTDFESYNSFLNEWAQLLLNAIILFKSGYFDCAYYSLRQAIELAIVVLYFHDGNNSPREEILSRWSNKQKFPSASRILDELKIQTKYKDIVAHLPNLFGELSSFQKQLHKIVHKQGYFYLYTIQNHPLIIPNKTQREFIINFEEYFRKTLKQIIIIRLLIDPIPIILADSNIRKTKLYMSDSLPSSLIDRYLEETFIVNYKKTKFYNQYVE